MIEQTATRDDLTDMLAMAGGIVSCTTDKVIALQNALLKLPQADIRTYHAFLPGIYERTIVIPPWTVLTGAEHLTGYKVRLEQGTIAVNIDNEIRILTAPLEFNATAGAQRAGRVFEEVVIWTDIYDNADDCRDIAEIERRIYAENEYGLADSRTEEQQARIDFELFMHQAGITKQELDAISQIECDMIDMPHGYGVEVRQSTLHGNGLFATKDFNAGDILCPGRLNGKRTPAGRYTNHANQCNIIPTKDGDDIYAVAVRNIRAGDEILVDYRASMRVNFGICIEGELPCLDG